MSGQVSPGSASTFAAGDTDPSTGPAGLRHPLCSGLEGHEPSQRDVARREAGAAGHRADLLVVDAIRHGSQLPRGRSDVLALGSGPAGPVASRGRDQPRATSPMLPGSTT